MWALDLLMKPVCQMHRATRMLGHPTYLVCTTDHLDFRRNSWSSTSSFLHRLFLMLLQFSLQVLKNHLMVEVCLTSWEISTLPQHFPLHPQPTILSLLAIVCFGFRNVQGIGGLLGNRKGFRAFLPASVVSYVSTTVLPSCRTYTLVRTERPCSSSLIKYSSLLATFAHKGKVILCRRDYSAFSFEGGMFFVFANGTITRLLVFHCIK